jgi:CRISPR-associated protein Cas6
MFWQEENESAHITTETCDVICRISSKTIPSDHIWELKEQILHIQPKLANDKNCILPIHISCEANGWRRDEDAMLLLSKRTLLHLRIIKNSIKYIEKLTDKTLNIKNNPMKIINFKTRPLKAINTLLARSVASNITDENEFLEYVAKEIKTLGINVKKMLCGKTRIIKTPNKILKTRSLLIAALEPQESITLQDKGIGQHKMLGCGVFEPTKSIEAVR